MGKPAVDEVYQVKITLLGFRPAIWRRLLVDPSTTLYGLHMIIQAVFGWEEAHPHEFILTPRERIGVREAQKRVEQSN